MCVCGFVVDGVVVAVVWVCYVFARLLDHVMKIILADILLNTSPHYDIIV